MKRVLILLLLLPLAFAADFQYTIIDNSVLTEISLSRNELATLELPSEIELTDYIDNEIIEINYITKSYLEKSGAEFFFIVKNPAHINSSISVTLPEGAMIKSGNLIFPNNYEMRTDGQSITLDWNSSNEQELIVEYYKINRSRIVFYLSVIFLLLIGIFLFYFKNNDKKKKFTTNLYRDEKEIMSYLIKKKECWTKEIVRDLKISKVKLSRKLRTLEEKGLIERIPFGNENRIKIKGK